MTHTPGPWTYRKSKKHYHVEAVASVRDYGSSITTVRHVTNSDTGWTSETNARLIAAAPELLEALQLLLSIWGDRQTEATDIAYEAVAKATGQEA